MRSTGGPWPGNSCREDRAPGYALLSDQFGCDGTAAVRIRLRSRRKRSVACRAGYPDGFDTESSPTTCRALADAMQDYLKAVGINARLTIMQTARRGAARKRARTRWTRADWGSYSINDVSAILPNFFTAANRLRARPRSAEAGGGRRRDHRSGPAAEELFGRDPIDHRARLWVPLYTYSITYGFSGS